MTAQATSLPEWPENLATEAEFVRALTERFTLVANSIRAGIDAAPNWAMPTLRILFHGNFAAP